MAKITYYRSEYLEVIHIKDKPITYSKHNHISVYTIGLVLSGRVTLKLDNEVKVFSQYSFFVINPYEIHELLLPESYNLLSLCIHVDLVTKYKSIDLYKMLIEFLFHLPLKINSTLLQNAVNALYQCKLELLDNKINSSANRLRKDPESDANIQYMANEVYLSKFHYIKVFKKNIGITPHKFRLQNRIRKAQRRIEHNENLTEIASSLGFYDQSHFIKCFKSIVGITPTEYKKSLKIQ